MDRYLKLSFDNVRGRNCNECMLSFSKGESSHCAALVSRPKCPGEDCRKDCPLIDNVKEYQVIEANEERFHNIMLYADYTINDYNDLFKNKRNKELLQI